MAIKVWIHDLKSKFRYYQKENEQRLGGGMWLVGIWGVNSEDTGNHLDPDSIGDLEFDSTFDLSQPEAQTWMTDFCHDLINASFVNKAELGGRMCSMDIFNSYITVSCSDLQAQLGPNWNDSLNDCCGIPNTPVDSVTFKKCYYYFTAMMSTSLNNLPLGLAFYDQNSQDMKAYTFEFRRN